MYTLWKIIDKKTEARIIVHCDKHTSTEFIAREKDNITHYVNARECNCAMTNAPVDFNTMCDAISRSR